MVKTNHKIRKTVLLIFVSIVIAAIMKLIQYKLDLYYASIAPEQLNSDWVYSALQTKAYVNSIIFYSKILLSILMLYFIVKVWIKKDKNMV